MGEGALGAMQRVHLIDNASAGGIHQGRHPFNAWSGRLCIKVQLPGHAVTLNRAGRHRFGSVVSWWRWAPVSRTSRHSCSFPDKKKGWQIHKTWCLTWANSTLCGFSDLSLHLRLRLSPAPPHARPHICRPTSWSFQGKTRTRCSAITEGASTGGSAWHFFLFFFVVTLTFENITD